MRNQVAAVERSRDITLAPKKLILTRRASEGSASEPSLARRVSMCRDAKLSCRGNMWRERARAKEAKTCSAEATQSIVESQSQELPKRSEQRGHKFAQLSAPLTAPHGTEKGGADRTGKGRQ